jgi:hypothetical protein
MSFYAFRLLSQTRLNQNSRGSGVGGEEVMLRHALGYRRVCVKVV